MIMTKALPTQDELLDVEKVAEMLAVSERQIQRLAAGGSFPNAFQAGEGTHSPWRIPRSDVEIFIKSHRAKVMQKKRTR